MLTLLAKQTVYLDGIEYSVVHGSPDQDTLLENKKTGERVSISTYSLVTKYLTGEFKTAAQRRAQMKLESVSQRPPARMDNMSDAAKKETHRRLDYLIRLDRRGAFSMSRKKLRGEIAEVAAERGERRPPHESTVYRWRRQYLKANNDVRALFVRFDSQGGKGQGRLLPEVESLIDDAIDEIALQQRRFSGEEIHGAVALAIERVNLTRSLHQKLKTPSLRTIFRRINLIADFDLATARFGVSEAKRRFTIHGSARGVNRILELVEIDHSPIDLMVCNSDREAIGRPTITVVLDRRSRCVLGYHLTL
jgi:putative transposase